MIANTKEQLRQRRKWRIRKKITGTAERPRLTVFRSARHIYAQVINDSEGTVLAQASTVSPQNRSSISELSKSECAVKVGQQIAEACKAKSIDRVVFDRNGYLYHGRVLTLANAAREAGLQF